MHTHTHTGHNVRHVRCGRPVHYRAFRDGPTHACVRVDNMTFAALCGETVAVGSGVVPNVVEITNRGHEPVTCKACKACKVK